MDLLVLWYFAQANAITGTVFGFSFIFAILGAIFYIAHLVNYNERGPDSRMTCELKKSRNFFGTMFLILVSLCVLLPDRTGTAIIIGGKLAVNAATSETVTDTTRKILDLVNQELDSRLQLPEDDK